MLLLEPARLASRICEYICCSAFSFCTRANVLAYSCARKSSGSSCLELGVGGLFVLAHLLLLLAAAAHRDALEDAVRDIWVVVVGRRDEHCALDCAARDRLILTED